jgi:hypothetical protein
MTNIVVRRQETRPKSYGRPRDLSLKAMGLLYHILLHLNTDGSYSWGNVKTAAHYGIHHNRIAEVLEELIGKGHVIDVQSGKDPETGKNRLRIVRPTAKAQKPSTPVCVGTEIPNTPVRVEPSHGKTKTWVYETTTPLSINESTHASEPLSVITSSSGNESVSIGRTNVGNVDDRHASVHGSIDIKRVRATLAEEQSELELWARTKNAKNAEACRMRIAELQGQLAGAR